MCQRDRRRRWPASPLAILHAMYDKLIRESLIRQISASDPDAVIFEELPLSRGDGRADCAAVNGHLSGYEIKSDSDSLRRLPGQISQYDRIFEFSSVVTTKRHLLGVRRLLPRHWGILLACDSSGSIEIRTLRQAKRNKAPDATAVLKLLWRNEVIKIAKEHAVVLSDPRCLVSSLWADVLAQLPSQQIIDAVRGLLKLRNRSQSVSPQIQGDD
jgi:type III secretion system FlhB-like substrate exporter